MNFIDAKMSRYGGNERAAAFSQRVLQDIITSTHTPFSKDLVTIEDDTSELSR